MTKKKVSAETLVMVEQLVTGGRCTYHQIPWYDHVDQTSTNEYGLTTWLEEKLGAEPKPTITLSSSVVEALFGEQEFRVLLTKAAVVDLLDRYTPLIEAKLYDRINGSYTPELNSKVADWARSVAETATDNYLRNRAPEIRSAIEKILDEKWEQTVENEVTVRLERRLKRIKAALDKEA